MVTASLCFCKMMQTLPSHGQPITPGDLDFDRVKELQEFDETEAGVKGLVDSGATKVPRIFVHPHESLRGLSSDANGTSLQIPTVDLRGYRDSRRQDVIDGIREASETWGFFQIINHGMPLDVMDNMLEGVKKFHEQRVELKKELYSRDGTKRVREAVFEYEKHIAELKTSLAELLSEALGLGSDYLSGTECMKSETVLGHYYPACPEPELTLGTAHHSDISFLTLLLQDHHGGLQILHENHWVDAVPVHGALLANIGDFMQLVTNGKFKSVEHRVLSGRVGPRVSVACFLSLSRTERTKPLAPIKELLSENNPPIYKETSISEYVACFRSHGLRASSTLPHFRISDSK
ncbi:hypothetical protein BT93_K0628 [Corymbia citriodora subsp. variegata]|nr:hypothetical protein BT93_K0628 [Corymbia citriodora subsp. variegata]